MKCLICKQGEIHPGTTTVALTRGETTVVIKNVPADICENCGEYYLSEEISGKILVMAEEAVKLNHEVEVIQFAA
ncbi:type II toxin-antitoxin system MqsA family antitoxin [Marinobacter halodurans]|uniref:Type II toxin-antitoxin system MqsA family antitoxin n=1 Tax=Marinobacter halodurans TaxID=2528979 RepID=A0ABY1ZJX4_9GAMM|nr:type II toxin-antitoxin system MqsA family antitoxin [Marinobacter halodurans]TBW55212.1 type II toxin-antitoxin system MqsA family antitoxin [Marinobacter halodurans]